MTIYDDAQALAVTGGKADKAALTAGSLSKSPLIEDSEILVAARTVVAADSRRTFYLGLAGGFTVTLPAPKMGLRFKFVVAVAPTTAYIISTNAAANILYGMMEERAGTAGVAGAAKNTINFVANQSKIGDFLDIESDGVNWYYHGMVDIAAGTTVA